MSRWRELIMDFGQIFGTEKSYASSDVFSVKSDLSAKKSADVRLRRALEVHFRPLFQRFVYGGEKIACHDLRRLLHDPEYRDRLPADKVQELEDLADFNKGKAISYNEFVRIVLGHQMLDDLASMGSESDMDSERSVHSSRFQNTMSFICRNTEPQEMVEQKMEKYKCCPPPFFMIGITLAQIIAYIVVSASEDVSVRPLEGVDIDNKLIYLPTRRREVWRYFSYCLLHQGFIDLFFNVVIQIVFGVPLEMMFSWWRLATVYTVGVVAGSCSHSMWDHYAGLAGASGGSYAILSAHVMALIMNWRHFNSYTRDNRNIRCLCSLPFRLGLVLIIVIPQVTLAVYRRFFLDDIPLKIGFASYFGGMVAGSAFSSAFLVDHKRKPWEGWLLFRCIFMLLTLIGSAIIFNITWNDYPDEDYS